jgi:hypothetical protein
MPGLVYILCAVTSLGIAILLWRGARRGGGGLLMWSSLCFIAMTANNLLLYVNFFVLPNVDLLLAARLVTTVGIILLNVGLIWHAT